MAVILIADDDSVALCKYKEILSCLGHTVILCKDGTGALESFYRQRPDLVILELNMPGMDGLQVCREIRRDPEGILLPIVMISAKDSEENILDGLNAGASDYLIKPVKEAHLLAKLKAFLGVFAIHKKDFDLVKNHTVFAGRYEIQKALGYGTHSVVFQAIDRQDSDRSVALKLLKEDFAIDAASEYYVQTANILKDIDCPYLLKIIDIGQCGGRIYMVLEYAEGHTLSDIIKKHRLNEEEAAKLGREITKAIKAIRNRGLIHLDIKPENILLHDGRFQLADFGLIVPRKSATMPLTPEIWSTAAYVSPEYLTREAELSSKSDIYSLAVTIYEAVAGDNPFYSDNPTVSMYRQVNFSPRPLHDSNPEFSLYFSRTIETMLSKKPEERPAEEDLEKIFSYLKKAKQFSQAENAEAVAALPPSIRNRRAEAPAAPSQPDRKEKQARDEKKLDMAKKLKTAKKSMDQMKYFKPQNKGRLGLPRSGRRQFSAGKRIIIIIIIIALFLTVTGAWLLSAKIRNRTGNINPKSGKNLLVIEPKQ